MNMSINFDLQFHYSWCKHQDLLLTNVEKDANLGVILNESCFVALMKRSFVTDNKFT